MTSPTVTFVVPCYRLAHFLPDCLRSILAQTFEDFEVLVMDDCSPDDTPAVTASFRDPRVQHVRNDPNLGHLRNYNKGIGLARGKYVWLISADDYLRSPRVLERYVSVLEANPSVGYAFCAGVGVRDGNETGTIDYSLCGDHDRVIRGHVWLRTLLRANVVLAASGLVRRACYERHGPFPLDMPWAGDWYLWCLFALYHDVAYFAEPMVCYREHALSMTNKLTKEKVDACCREEISIPWDIKRRADAAAFAGVSRLAVDAAADWYVRNLVAPRFGRADPCLEPEDLERSLQTSTADEGVRRRVRARVHAEIGDWHYWRGDAAAARRAYAQALEATPAFPSATVKRALLALGPAGDAVRHSIRWAARRARGAA
jgi:glycosyltransferase involved in cell wall biosynthesis